MAAALQTNVQKQKYTHKNTIILHLHTWGCLKSSDIPSPAFHTHVGVCTHKHTHSQHALTWSKPNWKHTVDSNELRVNRSCTTVASIKNYNPNFCQSYCSRVCAVTWTSLRPPRISYCATQAQFCLRLSAMNPESRVQANVMPRWTAIRRGAGKGAGCQMKQRVSSLCSGLCAC